MVAPNNKTNAGDAWGGKLQKSSGITPKYCYTYQRQLMILCMISDRLQEHGRLDIFLEWGMNHGNYQCLSDGLPSIGKAHILPPNPNGSGGNLHPWMVLSSAMLRSRWASYTARFSRKPLDFQSVAYLWCGHQDADKTHQNILRSSPRSTSPWQNHTKHKMLKQPEVRTLKERKIQIPRNKYSSCFFSSDSWMCVWFHAHLLYIVSSSF